MGETAPWLGESRALADKVQDKGWWVAQTVNEWHFGNCVLKDAKVFILKLANGTVNLISV